MALAVSCKQDQLIRAGPGPDGEEGNLGGYAGLGVGIYSGKTRPARKAVRVM